MWWTDSKTNIFQRQRPCYQSVTCVKADTTPHKYEALTFCTPSVWRLQHAHVFLLHSSVQPDAFHDTVNDSYGWQRDLDPGSVGESPASSPPSHGRSYTIYITRKKRYWDPLKARRPMLMVNEAMYQYHYVCDTCLWSDIAILDTLIILLTYLLIVQRW